MFDNIGKKIKILAVVLFVLIAVGGFCVGMGIMAVNDNLVAPGLSMIFGCPIAAWILSWLLYGYGELIDKTASIESILKKESEGVKTEFQAKEESVKAVGVEDERTLKLKTLREEGLISEDEYMQAISKKEGDAK